MIARFRRFYADARRAFLYQIPFGPTLAKIGPMRLYDAYADGYRAGFRVARDYYGKDHS